MKRTIHFLLIAFIGSFGYISAQGQKLKVAVGGREFTATLNNNETVNAFIAMLPITANMTEMGGYEKFYYLPQSLPGTPENVGTTYEGDLMIWSGNCLVLFYTTRPTSYTYIRLGQIDDTTGLRQAVGSGNVQVSFELERTSTGMNDVASGENKYNVYNAGDYLEVSGVLNHLTLLSLSGSVAAQSNENRINIAHIPEGIYILKIDTEKDGIITRKISKG